MPKGYVYLAGAITGLSGTEALGWREDLTPYLLEYGFTSLNPLRGQEDGVKNLEHIPADFDGGVVGVKRDLADIDMCDALIVNLDSVETSVGTNAEIGYAYAKNKFIFGVGTVNKRDLHPFYHTMITSNISRKTGYEPVFVAAAFARTYEYHKSMLKYPRMQQYLQLQCDRRD